MKDSLFERFPLIIDVIHEYRVLRQTNHGRDEAIQKVLENNSAALQDYDESYQVWIGLAKVTGQKNELTPLLLRKASSAFDCLSQIHLNVQDTISYAKIQVCDPKHIGPEAKYSQKHSYQPDWKIGDTFIYQLKSNLAKQNKMENWYAILRKTGEYNTPEKKQGQIVLLSVCKPNNIPTNEAELNNLGYIPTQAHNSNCFEFQWTINVGSKRRLDAYQLNKIGSFPNIQRPSCEFISDDPLFHGFPLFPACKSDPCSSIDYYAIVNYIKYGAKK